jgi:ribulose-phosphate 3-epimerase
MKMLSVSMLSADFGRLNEEVEMVNAGAADLFHLDVMDGRFVTNISYGFPVIKAIAAKARKPLDAHLMIVEPEKYIEAFRAVGVAWLSVHYEVCVHLNRTLQQIRAAGMKAGIALNPHTPVSGLADSIHTADFVLIMSVNPGFGGQAFIERSLHKIAELKTLITRENAATLIEVDGGIDPHNAAQLCAAGADILVAGNAIFGAADPMQAMAEFQLAVGSNSRQ